MYTPLCPLVGQGGTGLEQKQVPDWTRAGGGMGSSKSTRKACQAWGKAAATPSPGDPLPQPRLGTPRAHLPIAPRTSDESGAVNSKTQKNLRTSQCVWNRNLEPRRYITNCVTAATHCGTGTWNLRHSSRGTRTWNPEGGTATLGTKRAPLLDPPSYI